MSGGARARAAIAVEIQCHLQTMQGANFDFYSLFVAASAAPVENPGTTFAHFPRPVAFLKHSKQPSGLVVHLHGRK
jgi:hypothetical protein